MTDSIVDLGAAGEYISEKFEDVVDYFTGAPKARAGSRGFFKDLGPGVRQYYLGPGEKEGESFFEYLGFEDGGKVTPEEDSVVDLGQGGFRPEVYFSGSIMESTPQVASIDGDPVYGDLKSRQVRGRIGGSYETSGGDVFGAGVSGGMERRRLEFPSSLQALGAPDRIDQGEGRIRAQSYDAFARLSDVFGIEGAKALIRGSYTPSSRGEDFYEAGVNLTVPFQKGGVVELGEGSPMSMATKEELEEFLEFLRRNIPSFKEGETEQYLEFGEILGMQQVDPKSKVTVDGVVVQQPPIPPSFAGRRMDREEFYEGFAEPSRQITDEETQERRGITQKDIAEGRIRLRDLESAYSQGDPYAGELGAFVPRRIEIGPDGKEFESPVGFKNGGGIGGLMQMSTQTRLNDRDDAVGTKLMRQAGMQASANQVMDNLDPKVLAQMSRILGRNIG